MQTYVIARNAVQNKMTKYRTQSKPVVKIHPYYIIDLPSKHDTFLTQQQRLSLFFRGSTRLQNTCMHACTDARHSSWRDMWLFHEGV